MLAHSWQQGAQIANSPEPNEIADWLARWQLQEIDSNLVELHIEHPVDVLVLEDDDVANLKLKLSDPAKWDLAIEDLKVNMRQRRAVDKGARLKAAANAIKVSKKMALLESFSPQTSKDEDPDFRELTEWLEKHHLSGLFDSLRSLGVKVPSNVLDLSEEDVTNLHMKRLESKRWELALEELRGIAKPARSSEIDEIDLDYHELTEWLERHHLNGLFDSLRSLGVKVPSNVLDLSEEDVTNLHMKRLESKRWELALEELRGIAKPPRISDNENQSSRHSLMKAIRAVKIGKYWALAKSQPSDMSIEPEVIDHELSDWLEKVHLKKLEPLLKDLGVRKPMNTLTLSDDVIKGFHLKRLEEKRFHAALEELRKASKSTTSDPSDEDANEEGIGAEKTALVEFKAEPAVQMEQKSSAEDKAVIDSNPVPVVPSPQKGGWL